VLGSIPVVDPESVLELVPTLELVPVLIPVSEVVPLRSSILAGRCTSGCGQCAFSSSAHGF